MAIETVQEAIRKHKSGERWVEPCTHFQVFTIYELFEKISGGNVTKLKLSPMVFDVTDEAYMNLLNDSSFILDITDNVKTDYTLNVLKEGVYDEEYEDEDDEESEDEEDYDYGPEDYSHNLDITLHFTGRNSSADLFEVTVDWVETDTETGEFIGKGEQKECEVRHDKAYSDYLDGDRAFGIPLDIMYDIRFYIEEICISTVGKDGKPTEGDEKKISGIYNLIFRNEDNSVRGKLKLDALLFGDRMDITMSGDNGVMKCHHFIEGRIDLNNGWFLGWNRMDEETGENVFFRTGMNIHFDFTKKPIVITGKVEYAQMVDNGDEVYDRGDWQLRERWILETDFEEGKKNQEDYVNIEAGDPGNMDHVAADKEKVAEAAANNSSAENEDLGEYITRDADGDLYFRDPVTDDQILYKANGDGTYTNPLTGATYTTAELKRMGESRAENEELLRQDHETARRAVQEQREDNRYLSQDGYEYLVQKKTAEKKLAREIQLDHNWIKYGGERGNEESIRKAMSDRQARNEERSQQAHAYATRMDYIVKGLEVTGTGADIGVDILATVTGQQGIKTAYTVGKNFASRMSDAYVNNKDMSGAIAMAGFDSLTDIGLDKAEAAGFEVVGNVGAELIKNTTQNLYEGKDWNDGLDKAALKGTAKGIVSKVSNAFTDNQQAITKHDLKSDMDLIKLASQNKVSEKSMRYLQDIRLINYVNNLHAEKAVGGATAFLGDVAKLGIDSAAED
ncbi:MAG: hypothetical protein K6E91_05030 [Butyrivibrio sp.]|nr:hypothetical protein [Butyrivibrio sp.]